MLPGRVDATLCSCCILFIAVCTESDGKLNRGLAMRLQFCVSYLIDKATHVNVSARMCVVCTCMCGRGGGLRHNSALYVNEAVALVRIT